MKTKIKNIFNTDFKSKSVEEIRSDINILQKQMVGINGAIDTQAQFNLKFWSAIVERVAYLHKIKAITLKERRGIISESKIDKR